MKCAWPEARPFGFNGARLRHGAGRTLPWRRGADLRVLMTRTGRSRWGGQGTGDCLRTARNGGRLLTLEGLECGLLASDPWVPGSGWPCRVPPTSVSWSATGASRYVPVSRHTLGNVAGLRRCHVQAPKLVESAHRRLIGSSRSPHFSSKATSSDLPADHALSIGPATFQNRHLGSLRSDGARLRGSCDYESSG